MNKILIFDMKKLFFATILITYIFTSCDDPKTSFNISGQILYDSVIVENAIVNIDQSEQFQTETNEHGYFEFLEVGVGEHLLSAQKNFDNGSFVARSFEINIKNNVDLGEKHLPHPAEFIIIELDSATNTLSLKWNQSREKDFYRYKIYSHTTEVFNEETATLAFSTINITDTTYEYIMPSLTTLYFKLITLSDLGKLSESSIINVTSVNSNLLQYGNLENEEAFSELWSLFGNMYIQDTIYKEGNNALLSQSMFNTETIEWTTCLIEAPGFIVEQNEAYELSFWYKADGLVHMNLSPIKLHYSQDSQTFLEISLGEEWSGQPVSGTPFKLLNGVEWTKFSTTFSPSSSSEVYFEFFALADNLYFDNIRCEKVLE